MKLMTIKIEVGDTKVDIHTEDFDWYVVETQHLDGTKTTEKCSKEHLKNFLNTLIL